MKKNCGIILRTRDINVVLVISNITNKINRVFSALLGVHL